MIKTIFAYSPSPKGHAFGNGDSLPWPHLKQDMAWFKEDTYGQVVVMGAKTFESLPFALPGRVNVVLSQYTPIAKNGDCPDVICKGELSQILPEIQMNYPDKNICIIGGMGLIEQSIPLSDQIIATKISPVEYDFPATHYLPAKVISKLVLEYKMVGNTYVEKPHPSVACIHRFIFEKDIYK